MKTSLYLPHKKISPYHISKFLLAAHKEQSDDQVAEIHNQSEVFLGAPEFSQLVHEFYEFQAFILVICSANIQKLKALANLQSGRLKFIKRQGR